MFMNRNHISWLLVQHPLSSYISFLLTSFVYNNIKLCYEAVEFSLDPDVNKQNILTTILLATFVTFKIARILAIASE